MHRFPARLSEQGLLAALQEFPSVAWGRLRQSMLWGHYGLTHGDGKAAPSRCRLTVTVETIRPKSRCMAMQKGPIARCVACHRNLWHVELLTVHL